MDKYFDVIRGAYYWETAEITWCIYVIREFMEGGRLLEFESFIFFAD